MEFKKEKKKKYWLVGIIVFIAILIVTTLLDYGSVLLEIGVSLVTALLTYFALKYNWFKEYDKETVKEDKDALKKIDTIELKRMKNDYKYWFNITENEYNNRKDKSLVDKMSDEFISFLGWGLTIFIFGIMMFGGIPAMFGVNNEFVNPSVHLNYSGIFENSTNSINLVGDACEFTLTSIMDIGTHHPNMWFILFWATVIMGVLIPAIRILFYGFKYFYNKKKEGKHGI